MFPRAAFAIDPVYGFSGRQRRIAPRLCSIECGPNAVPCELPFQHGTLDDRLVHGYAVNGTFVYFDYQFIPVSFDGTTREEREQLVLDWRAASFRYQKWVTDNGSEHSDDSGAWTQ